MPKHERDECHHQYKTTQNIFQVEPHYDHEERCMLKNEIGERLRNDFSFFCVKNKLEMRKMKKNSLYDVSCRRRDFCLLFLYFMPK